jgi:demethylmenaquinone methyltransferase/2-methoxy-6-polyprenyl-1,4-benzoquinol methylase
LVHRDFTNYQFPKELDGIFATGALQYSPQYDKIIKKGYDALKTGKKFVIVDGKMSEGSARIFAPILLNFTKPFGAEKEYLKRQAWKSIEKYFEKTTFQEAWGGFLYLSVGTKA